jgi:hypothetical protein
MGYGKPDDVPAAISRAVTLVRTLEPPPAVPAEPPWPVLDPAAWHGPLGRYALNAAEHTEADPVGILAASLVTFGALVGRGPHLKAGNARHPAVLFVNTVGRTSKARKGTGWAGAAEVLAVADSLFRDNRVLGGFNSGEALADAFAPAGNGAAPDIRLLCLEPEFGRLLAVAGRDGSTLSALIRQAWDGAPLETRARGAKVVIKEHHLGLIGQITAEELRSKLAPVDVHSGFANRFLWPLVRRGVLHSDGGNIPASVISAAGSAVAKSLGSTRGLDLVERTPTARELWDVVYREIADDDPPGVLGAVISRGDTQTLRLSLDYALADASPVIDVEHVEAAYALWRYCRASAAWIWGSAATGLLGQKIVEALARHPEGMSLTRLHGVFHRHLGADDLRQVLGELQRAGYIEARTVRTGGRSAVVHVLAEKEESARGGERSL